MDRADIVQRLTQAHDAVYMGTERVRRQRRLVARLNAMGDVSEKLQAKALLAAFENSLGRHIEERRIYSKELLRWETWVRAAREAASVIFVGIGEAHMKVEVGATKWIAGRS